MELIHNFLNKISVLNFCSYAPQGGLNLECPVPFHPSCKNENISTDVGGMVSALDCGANGLDSSPGHYTLTVPPSTQVYKWVLVNEMLGGYPVMDQHSISCSLMSHLGQSKRAT